MDRTRLGEDDLVYFLHIPRTGGTSFFEVLASHFHPEEVRKGDDRRTPEEDLRAMPREELARYRLLSGHHDVSVARRPGREPHFVTMLREPVARTMSTYRILQQLPHHPLHGLAMRSTFLEFLQHPDGGRADADRQTRQLAGALDGNASGPDLLDRAKERLESLAFFGLRERFEDSVRLLEATFGWEPVEPVPHLNATGDTNHRLALDARELELTQERNRMDLELYRFARRLWRERSLVISEPVLAFRD
ncbi:MAG TPA: sulfotransferase family 2 domain-containing protein [bacterium]|nr:sulfotransferase family 2 domain-containing protein [bacterium]